MGGLIGQKSHGNSSFWHLFLVIFHLISACSGFVVTPASLVMRRHASLVQKDTTTDKFSLSMQVNEKEEAIGFDAFNSNNLDLGNTPPSAKKLETASSAAVALHHNTIGHNDNLACLFLSKCAHYDNHVDSKTCLPVSQEPVDFESDEGAAAAPAATATKLPDLPPAPKRPKTAYIYFCMEKRPKIQTRGKSIGEVAKELSKLWEATSPYARRRFDSLAKADREEYDKQTKSWKAECQRILDQAGMPGVALPSRRKSKKRKKALGPKRAKTAYMYFCDEKRPQFANSEYTFVETSKELSKLWAATTDKSPYEALAAADKVRYQQEKAAFPEIVEDEEATTTTKRAKRKGGPKRGKTAYRFFCDEKRPELASSGMSFGEMSSALGKMWGETTDRKRFEDMAAADKLRYQRELEQWEAAQE